MFNQRSVSAVLLAATITIGICLSAGNRAAALERLKNFPEVLAAARRIESAGALLSNENNFQKSSDKDMIFQFLNPAKGSLCENQYKQQVKNLVEYKVKALEYAADCKKGNNWFTTIVKLGGPLGSMKGISKSNANMNSLTQNYEIQCKNGGISNDDIECDMFKLRIKTIDPIMFVLRSDIKNLIMGDQHLANIAIFRQLQADKFMSNTNLYNADTLTSGQQQLILDFFASRVDTNKVRVEDALERVQDPGSLIIGRLLDSCLVMTHFQEQWAELSLSRKETCNKSKLDKQDTKFASLYNEANYDEDVKFCREFLESV